MHRSKIILVLLLIGSGVSAQTNLDSFYSVWQDETQPDSTRTSAYKDYIAKGYIFSNPDTAIILARDLLTYGEQHQYAKASATAYFIIASSNHIKSDYPKALDYYQRSLKISREIGDKSGMADAIGNIGIIYVGQDNYPKALDYFQRGLKIYTEIGNIKGSATAIGSIGTIYAKQGNTTNALDYFQRSLKIYKEIGDKRSMGYSIGNIGFIYKEQGDYSKAVEYFKKALSISQEIGDKNGSANAIGNIGEIYREQGDYPKALKYCEQAFKISEEIVSLVIEKDACQCLYETYKAMGKGNEALVYMEKMQVIDDSLNTQETSKKLQQMEFAKQMFADSIAGAEKERLVEEAHQEEVQKKNNTRNGLMGGGALVILLAGGLYSRLRYVRKSKASLQIEKDRSENLLLNILPEEIAQELKIYGKAEARDFDLVSILFTDFKGFTEASAKMSASLLVGEINTCFEAFDGIMEKHKIEKIKTIGDSYMAAGGLPVPTDDSVKNTVKAAIEMQSFITKRKAENEAQNKPAFEMRVGVHTGPVVAGIVGVKKFQYDVWGDTVNTASRMESNGEVGKVNISQSTYELIKTETEFKCESRGKIEAKGKGEIEMWFVASPS
jgi:adenylate cyclase